MTRPSTRVRVPGTLLAGLLAGFAALAPAPAPAQSVVIVLMDDAAAAETAHMPTLKQIAREGATFTRAYTPTPICVPSRATVQTGMYRQKHGTTSNGYKQFVDNGRINQTFAVKVQGEGVETSLFGKYLNGAPSVVPGWSVFGPHVRGGLYYDYSLRVNGRTVAYGHAARDYSTDVYRDLVLERIRSAVAADRRFLTFMSVPAAHNPSTPAPRHASVRGLTDRQRSLLAVDDALAAITGLLRETGRLDDTYLVITSDHGVAPGRPGGKAKGVPYEGAIKVPLVIRGPGVRAGATLDHLVNLADLAPTIAAWMEAPGTDADGRSLVPLLGETPPPPARWRQAMPIAHTRTDSASGVPSWQGVRTARYTYVRFAGGPTELYDTAADPRQRDNLARGNPGLVRRLATLSDTLARCLGAQCRAAEDAWRD